MIKLHYEVIAKKFENYDLICYDTDSFVYKLQCDDFYEWRQNNKDNFDLSDDKLNKDDTNKNKWCLR